jgi:hypothetical protein
LSDDEGLAVSYKVLQRGTPVWTADGAELGRVRAVLENEREHIFDGVVVETRDGPRFVDAPEVARIAERRVTLTIDAAAAEHLPERDPKGGAEFHADVRGRLGRLWRRRGR